MKPVSERLYIQRATITQVIIIKVMTYMGVQNDIHRCEYGKLSLFLHITY